jgi:uncharacterized protein
MDYTKNPQHFALTSILNFTLTIFAALFTALFTALFAASANAGAFEDFFEAIRSNKPADVAQMLTRGMDVNSVNEQGTPATVLAATYKADEVLKLLAGQRKVNIEAAGSTGETALSVTAWHGNQALVGFLIDKGAQINRQGWTALHYAAGAGHKDLVKYLLDRSAYIDAHSPNQTTPLMMAARERRTDIVRLLLEEGADPSQVNQAGLSAADYLERHKETAMAAELRQRAIEFAKKYAVPKDAVQKNAAPIADAKPTEPK